MPVNGRNGRDREWTHEEALDAGRRWVEAHGQPPTRSELNPATLRRTLAKARRRVADLEERLERFEPGEMPGAAVVARLFGGMDSYLHALGYTPRGTGRTPRMLEAEHKAQTSRVLEELRAGHRQILDFLARATGGSEDELRYQRRRSGTPGPVEPDLAEMEAAGLVRAEVRVTYRLTDEGKRLAAQAPAGATPYDAPSPPAPSGRRARPRHGEARLVSRRGSEVV